MGLVEVHDSDRDGYGYMHRSDVILPATRTDAQKGGASTDSCHTRPGNPSVEAFACYAHAVNPTYITRSRRAHRDRFVSEVPAKNHGSLLSKVADAQL